jgi:multidrug efflux pump subunit AcrA (membrane-fusion protein)
MFVRVQLPVGAPQESLLVPERALVSDQGSKFLYVVGQNNKVESRRVVIGQQEVINGESYRVVWAPPASSPTHKVGIKAGEKVVITGMQRIREGVEVTPVTPEMIAERAQKSEANRRTE